jgi:hypothetical protein
MPSKKKKKKKTQRQENLLDFDLYFDDHTILEADGEYDRVKELMDEDLGGEWDSNGGVVKTHLTIFSPFGQGQLTLDFHHDGQVYIVGFMSSNMSVIENMDVRCVSAWCQEKGWKIPQVSPILAQDNMKFWKHWWESLIIDSDYFDNRYGKRRALEMRKHYEGEDEDGI